MGLHVWDDVSPEALEMQKLQARWDDKAFVLEQVKQDGMLLRHAKDRTPASDREVVEAAIDQYPGAIEFADVVLRNETDIALRAVSKQGAALAVVGNLARMNPFVVSRACAGNPQNLDYSRVPDETWNVFAKNLKRPELLHPKSMSQAQWQDVADALGALRDHLNEAWQGLEYHYSENPSPLDVKLADYIRRADTLEENKYEPVILPSPQKKVTGEKDLQDRVATPSNDKQV